MSTTNTSSPQQTASLYPNLDGFKPQTAVPVGGVLLMKDDIEYNTDRTVTQLTVRNTGDRPIQVGSHYHFFEVNRYLEFDREAAFGCHLNIPATTAIRFEPGDEKKVEVVNFSGKRRVIGFNGLTMGYTGDEEMPSYFPTRIKALCRMRKMGYKDTPKAKDDSAHQTCKQSKKTE